ncbi:MAG: LicD family protein [Lachnospiraceae bacterium]|nr:LicD family protein [Lachnospiraceae bacterium]
MDFSYEYFKAEMRGETLISETTKKAWAASVETLSEVIRAIEARHLHYCALYGTLLGAVRHKGFIPWDDDIDIGMPRSDYEIFRKSCFEDLPEGYNVMDPCEEDVKGLDILRINNTLDPNMDPEFLQKYHGCPYIIGVDVYPIDNVPDDDEMDGGICDALTLIARILTIDDDIENATRDDLLERAEMIRIIESSCHCSLPEDEMFHINLMRQFDRLSSAYKGKKTEKVTVYRNHYFLPKHVFPRGTFSQTIDLPFENITIKVPKDFDAVLRTMYGNYMKPRQWKNTVHQYGFEDQQRFIYDAIGYLM